MRVGILLSLLAVSVAFAADAATRPMTAPVAHLPPAATPKEALRSLHLALRDGDAISIRALLQAPDAEGDKLVLAMADYAAALVALHQAANAAFGAEAADTVTGDLNGRLNEELASIDRAVATINGETATVRYAGATDAPIKLIRMDGRWKLPLSQVLDGADKAAQESRYAELTHQAGLARVMAEEIGAGKYKEPNKAREAWRSRLLEPVTKPTTKPSAGK